MDILSNDFRPMPVAGRPVFFVIGLSFLIDKLPPCLSKQLLGKLLSQALDHKLYEILLLFIKGF